MMHLHLIILFWASVISILFIAFCWYKKSTSDFYSSWDLGAGMATMLGGFVIVGTLIAFIPYQSQYWYLFDRSGSVAEVSNRFVEGSGDITMNYTVTLEGDPTPYVITDSRIMAYDTGDQIELTCSLGWVYQGADSTNCYLRSY